MKTVRTGDTFTLCRMMGNAQRGGDKMQVGNVGRQANMDEGGREDGVITCG